MERGGTNNNKQMSENLPKQLDPTLNVREMINESIQRVDDLRNAEVKRLGETRDTSPILL